MLRLQWYPIATLPMDRPDFDEQRARLEAVVRHAVEDAAEEYDQTIFATWTTLGDGTQVFCYATSSQAVFGRCAGLARLEE